MSKDVSFAMIMLAVSSSEKKNRTWKRTESPCLTRDAIDRVNRGVQ